MKPEPHRISLTRGWKWSQERWERTFHAPTLPATVIQVRLILTPSPTPDSRIQLNGQELTWSKRDSQLDCDITDRLQSTNKLVIDTASGFHANAWAENGPPFETYLEIFDEA